MNLFWLIASASAAYAFQTLHPRTLELKVYRNFDGTACTSATLRDAQPHKALVVSARLADAPPHVFERTVFNASGKIARDGMGPEERLVYFAYDHQWLRAQHLRLCGEPHQLLEVAAEDSQALVADAQQVIMKQASHASQNMLRHPPLRLQPLIQSGPSSNRVDLVFFSDGYTLEEYDKFIEDATRLAEDVSSNHTFNTVKPLLNFWAAFTPSNEHGIGTGGKPKDTPYGLYRDGTELRGVYYTRPEVARAACSALGDRCDYPILLGNDPLYGGLGGEFTVITPSLANGPLVLRHELGHSIIDVGEEYDGGTEYFGVNAADAVDNALPWAHWLTGDKGHSDHDACTPPLPRVERAAMPLQEYAWTMLNTSHAWTTRFTSAGTYERHVVRFSLSGVPDAHDLRVALDGRDLGWAPRPDIGVDRWHYDVHVDAPLGVGAHEVAFELRNAHRETAQLCSVEVLEFGDEAEFNAAPGFYGAFPTFSIDNATTYRPTNEDCLMRVVTSPDFCSVCMEGLWLSLLQRVDLVEDVVAGCTRSAASGAWQRTLTARLVPLAQLRGAGAAHAADAPRERYHIRWTKDGAELEEFRDMGAIAVADAVGVFGIEVRFETEEVRVDSRGYLAGGGDVHVERRCGSDGRP